jgi:hypothetical protein
MSPMTQSEATALARRTWGRRGEVRLEVETTQPGMVRRVTWTGRFQEQGTSVASWEAAFAHARTHAHA